MFDCSIDPVAQSILSREIAPWIGAQENQNSYKNNEYTFDDASLNHIHKRRDEYYYYFLTKDFSISIPHSLTHNFFLLNFFILSI